MPDWPFSMTLQEVTIPRRPERAKRANIDFDSKNRRARPEFDGQS